MRMYSFESPTLSPLTPSSQQGDLHCCQCGPYHQRQRAGVCWLLQPLDSSPLSFCLMMNLELRARPLTKARPFLAGSGGLWVKVRRGAAFVGPHGRGAERIAFWAIVLLASSVGAASGLGIFNKNTEPKRKRRRSQRNLEPFYCPCLAWQWTSGPHCGGLSASMSPKNTHSTPLLPLLMLLSSMFSITNATSTGNRKQAKTHTHTHTGTETVFCVLWVLHFDKMHSWALTFTLRFSFRGSLYTHKEMHPLHLTNPWGAAQPGQDLKKSDSVDY